MPTTKRNKAKQSPIDIAAWKMSKAWKMHWNKFTAVHRNTIVLAAYEKVEQDVSLNMVWRGLLPVHV